MRAFASSFAAPTHAGELEGPLRVAVEDQGVCINLYVEVGEGAAEMLRFQAWGCPHVIAAAEAFCTSYEGRPVADLLEFSASDLMQSLPVPVEKTGRILVIEDAVRSLGNTVRNASRPKRLRYTEYGNFTDGIGSRTRAQVPGNARQRRLAPRRDQDRLLRLFLCHQLCRRKLTGGDVVFEDRGVKIVVDPDALQLIDGTEVDFVKNGLNEAFSFKNPNVTGECGCGESFNI